MFFLTEPFIPRLKPWAFWLYICNPLILLTSEHHAKIRQILEKICGRVVFADTDNAGKNSPGQENIPEQDKVWPEASEKQGDMYQAIYLTYETFGIPQVQKAYIFKAGENADISLPDNEVLGKVLLQTRVYNSREAARTDALTRCKIGDIHFNVD